ncbi:MAG TPA: hypothetical protein VFT59_00645 [Candidatus Saccharimonadales bacterium]|nr:hypothetical protein [Candidatus Saccharimonadales bacterium]
MLQSHENKHPTPSADTMPRDYENTPIETSEYGYLVELTQAIAKERESTKAGEAAHIAKQHDWASLTDRIEETHAFTHEDIEEIQAALVDIPANESLQLLQQLAMRGMITRNMLPDHRAFPSTVPVRERIAEIRRQSFINHYFDLAQQGEAAIDTISKKPNTLAHKEFFQNLSSHTSSLTQNLLLYSQNNRFVEDSDEARDIMRRHFHIDPEQPSNELRNQVAEKILTSLDQSTYPLQELEQLARLDSQYIAGFIRSYEEFDGISRDQLIDLLATYDPEQIIHLAKENSIDKAYVTIALTSEHVSPTERARLSMLALDSLDHTELSRIARQLPITELYQLAKDSPRWHDITRSDEFIQASIREQITTVINQQTGPISKINALNRFTGFGATEQFVAEQKELLYEELLNDATNTNVDITSLPHLDTNTQTQLQLRLQLQECRTVEEAANAIDSIDRKTFDFSKSITPAEQAKLLEVLLSWREQLSPSPDGNDEQEQELDSEILFTVARLLNSAQVDRLLLAHNKPLVERVLDKAHSYLAKLIAGPEYDDEGGVYDYNTLTLIANITQDPALAASLVEHLSPTSIATTLSYAAERRLDYNSLQWLQLVDPKARQAFLDRSSNHLITGLVLDDIFPDDAEAKSAALVKVMTHTGLGARDLEQLRVISRANGNIPSSTGEARFLLNLYKNYGDETTAGMLRYLPLYKITSDHEASHMSIVNEGLRSGNVFVARFGMDYFEVINKLPGGRDHWKAIQASADAYFTQLAEISAKPDYLHDMSLLKPYNASEAKGTARERFEREYKTYQETMLRAWQSQMTGMTNAQIDTMLASLSELSSTSLLRYSKSEGPLTLAHIAQRGYFGPVLLEYSRHEKVIKDILNNDAVVGESLQITDILDSEDMSRTIDVLLQSASELSSSRTDAERYAHIASKLVMQTLLEGGDDWRGTVLIPSEAGPVPLSSMTQAAYESLAAQTLTKVLEEPIEARRNATQHNMERARVIEQQGDTFVIPKGSFIHETHEYTGVLQGTANLAGEHLGVKKLDTDSFPGFVDLVKTDDEWGDVELGSYATHRLRYAAGSALVYLPESDVIAQPETSSGIHGHHLAFGGIANTKLGLIVDFTEDNDSIESARQAQVETGLYIPIVDRSGNLLFTPEDYRERFENLKQYQSLPELVSTNIYSAPLYETPDPGGVGSIAEHMERSVLIARELSSQAGLDDSTASIVLAAMKLHDIGKIDDAAQEISNVAAARDVLRHVDELTNEDRRKILLLIKHDELLGEVLKNFDLDSPQLQTGALPRYAWQKLEQFYRVFENEALRRAAIVVYQADVAAKNPEAWSEWQVPDKLTKLGLPIYQPRANYF